MHSAAVKAANEYENLKKNVRQKVVIFLNIFPVDIQNLKRVVGNLTSFRRDFHIAIIR